MLTFTFLCSVSFLAGFMDSIGGGGGLLSLPALLAANLPPHIALGTNQFQFMFGTATSFYNYARNKNVNWKMAALGISFSIIGSIIGVKLVLIIPSHVVAKVIVILIPIIAGALYFSKRPKIHVENFVPSAFCFWFMTPVICLSVGAYDGFLGPGSGTFLILALVFFSRITFLSASATSKAFNLGSNVGAFVTFFMAGCVYFPYAIAMAVTNMLGSYAGSHYAMRHGTALIRKILFLSMALLFGYLVLKYFVGFSIL